MTQRKIKGAVSVAQPWDIPEYDPADIGAIKALIAGVATEQQQMRLVRWIERATSVGEMSFRPGADGARESAFAEGKRFVGLQFFTLAKAVMPASSSNAAP